MFTALVAFIFMRPLIPSLAYPYLDIVYSAALIAALIIWIGIEKPYAPPMKTLLLPLGLFLLGTIISIVTARNRVTGLMEFYKYIPVVLMFYAAAHFDDTKRRAVIRAILGSGLAVCVLAVYQYFFGFPHLAVFMKTNNVTSPVAITYVQSKRVFAPFVTPNILAGYCAMIIPLTLIERKYRWLALPLGFVLVLTRSIGGFLALSAALYLSFFMFTKFRPERLILLTLLLGLAGFILVLRLGSAAGNADPFFSQAMRLEYWRNTLAVIKSAPLLGIGPGNLDIAKSLYTHNSYLQLWAESGILAVAGFIWLAAAAVKKASASYLAFPRRPETPFLVCGVLVFLFHNLIDFSFFLPEASMAWWILLGLLRD
jgi:O-antigen ligase